MDTKNSFVLGERYVAYANATNEKTMLQAYMTSEYLRGNLPVKPHEKEVKRILDLGCGTGANLWWLMDLFSQHDVIGVERSAAQVSQINIDEASVLTTAFENYQAKTFDVILVSHVLQYIDTDPGAFIMKIMEHVALGGEVWIIQQTRVGMNQLISTVREYLYDSRFTHWRTYEDYVQIVHNLGLSYKTAMLPTSFEAIDFQDMTDDDRLRLEFMLCLHDGYEQSDIELKNRLSRISYKGRITHPNGIIKIRR